MGDESAVAFRILGPRDLVTGVTDTEDALENVQVDQLPDGSICWVTGSSATFRWRRSSVSAPNGTTIILPAGQSLLVPGRWIVDSSGSGGLVGAAGGQLSVLAPAAFNFTSSAGTLSPVRLAAPMTLSEAIDFDQPLSGRLRYIGAAAARFRISFQMVYIWSGSAGPATLAQFVAALMFNGGEVASSRWLDRLDSSGGEDDIGSFQGDMLISCDPGEFWDIGINMSDDPGSLQSGAVLSCNLIASIG